MKILAIDTSCDETSVAVSENTRVLSNIIHSQITEHKDFGGVVPNIAKREHEKNLPRVFEKALTGAKVQIEDIDALAITIGPGLAMALEVGVKFAKTLAQKHNLPLIAVNHMEGHLLSAFAQNSTGEHGIKNLEFPALGLLVSGGHTELVLMKNFGEYNLAGQTVDDAAGEAFDKVARMLGLSYPGGPEISKRAERGEPKVIELPVPMKWSSDLIFSFAGLKTASLYRIQKEPQPLSEKFINDFCLAFETAVVSELILKLRQAIGQLKPKMVLLGGGVIANKRLQREIKSLTQKKNLELYLPFERDLLLDNAAMIGVCAYFQSSRNDYVRDISNLDRQPRLEFGEKYTN